MGKYEETFDRVVKRAFAHDMHLIEAEHLIKGKFLMHSCIILNKLLCETRVRYELS